MSTTQETRERTEAAIRKLLGVHPGSGRRRGRPVIDEEFLARARAENAVNRREATPAPAETPAESRPRRPAGRRGDRA